MLYYEITSVGAELLKMLTLVLIHFCGEVPVDPQLLMIDCINQRALIFNRLIRRSTKMTSANV